MNIALITAGGCGQRMGKEIPKQFLSVEDKPIIIYTLEKFQNHPAIDKIIVACKEGWKQILESYCKQFKIDKLECIIKGGENGQESIKNLIEKAREKYDEDDIVLVHDGIRPMVSADIISDSIYVCKEKGCAIASIPCREAMLYTDDKESSEKQIMRDLLVRTQTPQAFRLKDLYNMHIEAKQKGISNSVASCTLAVELGKKVYFSLGSEKNLKITVPDDLDIFKALLNMNKRNF